MCANAQRVADCCQFDHDAYISNIKIKHFRDVAVSLPKTHVRVAANLIYKEQDVQ